MKKKYYIIIAFSLLFLSTISFSIAYKNNKKDLATIEKVNQEVNSEEFKNKPDTNEDNPKIFANTDKEQASQEIIISSVGDITLGTDDNFTKNTSLPAVYVNSNDPEYLFKNVANIFKNDNLTIGNLETTFTTSINKREKKFNFKGHPSLANSLVLGGIEGVNISNNHIYDYGQEGFSDTIKTLKDYKVNYFGEGSRWLTTINGVKFGFLGYQGWRNDKKLLKQIKKDIESLKSEDRIVIINFHWGEERKYTPNSVQKYLAHYAIDNGADLIIGHHPHVIQSIEKYKNRFIAYSLGNFCFGGNSNPPDKDTFILQSKFNFDSGKLSSLGLKVLPCSISSVPYRNDYSPTPLLEKEKARFLEKLNNLNINMDTKVSADFIYINLKEGA